MSSGEIKTKRALAIEIGRHHSTVLDWLCSPAWPFSRTGPWPMSLVKEIQQWAANRPPPGFSPINWEKHLAKLAATTKPLSKKG